MKLLSVFLILLIVTNYVVSISLQLDLASQRKKKYRKRKQSGDSLSSNRFVNVLIGIVQGVSDKKMKEEDFASCFPEGWKKAENTDPNPPENEEPTLVGNITGIIAFILKFVCYFKDPLQLLFNKEVGKTKKLFLQTLRRNLKGKRWWGALKKAASSFGNAITSTATAIGNAAADTANKAADAVASTVNKAVDTVASTANKAADAVASTANKAADAVASTANTVGNAVASTANTVGNAAADAVNAVGNAAASTANAVGNAAAATVNAVGNALNQAGEEAAKAIVAAGNVVVAGFENIADIITKTWDNVQNLAKTAISHILSLYNYLVKKLQIIINSEFITSLKDVYEKAKDAIKGSGVEIVPIIGNIYDKVTTILSASTFGVARVFIALICNFEIFAKALSTLGKAVAEKDVNARYKGYGMFIGLLIRAIGSRRFRLMKLYLM